MHPVLFKIGAFTFYSYGFFLALGFFLAAALAEKEGQRQGLSEGAVWQFCSVVLIAGIAGARLLFVFLNFDFFRANPLEIVMLQHGGLVWYGGLSAGLVCGIVYLRRKGYSVGLFLGLLAPYLALGQSLGRVGCFFNGCCYGRLWPGAGIVYPTQILSSLAMLSVFVILRLCPRRKSFVLYLLLCSAIRFFMEFLRGDSPVVFYGLTIFQLISAGIFLAAGIWWFCLIPKKAPRTLDKEKICGKIT